MSLKRGLFLVAAAVGLLVGLVTVVRSQPDSSMVPLSSLEPLTQVWQHSLRDVVALAVSPAGDRVLSVDLFGEIRCYDEPGRLVWRDSVHGADSLAISRGGSLSVVYGRLRPFLRDVRFYDAGGTRFYTLSLKDLVRTAIVSPDGHLVAVASGSSIFLCSRRDGDSAIRVREIPLGAEPDQIQFGPGDSVYAACRNPACVLLVKSTRHILWERKSDSASEFSISANEDGTQLAIGGQKTPDELQVTLVDNRNRPQWSMTLPGRDPRVRLAAGGHAVMLVYSRRLEHGVESRYERRLAYLDGAQAELWQKGGVFTAPLSVALSPHGEWTVALDTQSRAELPCFRLYGRDGKRWWKYNSMAGVLLATSSAEGRHIVSYRTDGMVEFIKVATP